MFRCCKISFVLSKRFNIEIMEDFDWRVIRNEIDDMEVMICFSLRLAGSSPRSYRASQHANLTQ